MLSLRSSRLVLGAESMLVDIAPTVHELGRDYIVTIQELELMTGETIPVDEYLKL
jgi:hypothetical protein